MRLADYCLKMQAVGIRVDTDLVERLETAIQSKKATLFPCEYSWEPKARAVKPPKPPKPIRYKKDGTPCKVKEAKAPKEPKPLKPLKKPRVIWKGPFNPNSPKAVTEYFDSHDIALRDRGGKASAGKQIVLKALEKALRPYGLKFDPKSGELEGTYEDNLPEHVDNLLKLAQKQNAGKGVLPWYGENYLHAGKVHSRFNDCGTSMGRLSSTKPNLQNVSKNGWGRDVRRCLIPEPGCDVIGADFSSLELFMCLWFARSSASGEGVFEHIVNHSDGKLKEAGKLFSLSERAVAKSLVHAGNYLEGLILCNSNDLNSATRRGDRKAGALLVYDGQDLPLWMFRGRYVTFTGANLAERLFGNRTRESRKKALELQVLYFALFPELQNVYQRGTLKEIETKKGDHYEVRLPHGHRLPLYGRTPEDDAKQAVALKGQGGGACYSQEGMLTFGDLGEIMPLQVHDEYTFFNKPSSWSDEEVLKFMSPMVRPSHLIIRDGENGFSCPAKVYRGPNWGEKRELGRIRWNFMTNKAEIY